MKRFLALLLCLVSVVACVAGSGCKKGLTDEQKKNALIIEYYKAGYGEVWIQNLASEFTKRTGQEVVLLPRSGNEGLSSMTTSLESGTSQTDLFFMANPSFDDVYRGRIEANGKFYDCWYADLSDLYSSTIEGENITVADKMHDAFEQYYKMPNDGKYYSDKYYFFPWVTGMLGIVVNMDVWNTVAQGKEFPRTTDELLELCESVKSKVAPFIYSIGDEYWTSIYQLYMAQYEGKARMDKFYQGYGPNQEDRYDTNMIAYEGLKQSLKFFVQLLKPENGYMHTDSKSLTFMQMQGSFLNGAALFNVNGDWLEREMITKYPEANSAMMKSPVLSAVADKCSFKTAENRDKILRDIIDYVDGKTQTAPTTCTPADIEIVREARGIEYVSGNESVAVVPSYANQISSAKKFLKFMASDDGMKIFRDGTNGCELPFNYTTPTTNLSVTTFRKSINDALSVSETRFVNAKDKIFSLGGINVYLMNNSIGRFVKAFTSDVDRKTAEQYFNSEISAVNGMLNEAKRQAGIL